MKSNIYFITLLFILGCTQTQTTKNQVDSEESNRIIIKAHDVIQNGDATPITFQLNPALLPGEVLILRHKTYEFARIVLEGNIKLKKISLRVRTMGTGNIEALLRNSDGQEIRSIKSIIVNSYNPIPINNTYTLKKKIRIQDGGVKMIVLNSSAERQYLEKITMNFGTGKVIIHGSKYFSKHPYFAIYPDVSPDVPEILIQLHQ